MHIPILKVRLYGDPVLRKKSVLVKSVGPAERLLIQSMIATMHDHKGIGLAAPQVGINQQILVADVGDGPIAIINPHIVKRTGSGIMEEGCLSIPGITVEVKRPSQITVRYTDENGQKRERSFSELMARVIQHENDHLNGKLIVDYAPLSEKMKFTKKLKELKSLQKKD